MQVDEKEKKELMKKGQPKMVKVGVKHNNSRVLSEGHKNGHRTTLGEKKINRYLILTGSI